MNDIDLNAIKNIHFIGIGGIGVSAIAQMMLLRGAVVSGSDTGSSLVTDELIKHGAKVFTGGQKAEQVPSDADLVVYTVAVRDDNPELVQAKTLGIKTLTYPEVLGIISRDHYTIAVSGTHGKTTTTGMLAKVFIDAKKTPTVVIGSFLKDFESNFIAGVSDYFIVEACEYRRSFLNLWPTIGVITNIDNDHLDYYENIGEIEKAFHEFALRLPESGYLICDATNERLKDVIVGLKCQVIDYKKFYDHELLLKVPGEHNRNNAAIVLAVVSILKLDEQVARKALTDFSGTWRRFEYKGETKEGVIVYDDYAHHPTEIKATLQGAREKFPDKKITVVFQPHLYSRTKLLLDDFAKSFDGADLVILAPIYAAREAYDETISSNMLAEKMKENGTLVVPMPNLGAISEYLKSNLPENSVLITMGAGDVYKVGEIVLNGQ